MLFPGKSINSMPVVVTGMVLLAAGVIVSCGQPGEAGTVAVATPYHAPPLTWTACRNLPDPGPDGPQPPRNLQCAKLTVPLDYANPGKGTIRLALIRIRATDQAHRIGSLVFNFGGPGGSGVDPFAAGAGVLFEKLGTRYDLVGVDPRGAGQSSPVTCLEDKQKDAFLATDTSPDNARETTALIAAQRAFVQGCQQRSGKILPHVGTIDAVEDLDVLRAALGDRKLNYFGFSYGTWLGASYAHRFPKNVGRAVFDAAVRPDLPQEQFGLQQAASFQRALKRFSRWADQQPGAKGRMLTKIAKLLKRLDAKPIRIAGGRKLTQSHGAMGILIGLYSKEFWPALREGIEQATAGDGTTLLDLSDAYPQRGQDGHYANMLDAGTAISCADATERYTERDVMRALPEYVKASPIFGQTFAWGLLTCTGWPYKGSDAAQKVDAPGAPPIVVIGTTGDPATPYEWAPWLAKTLGRGVLLTLKGDGHGAYPTGDACIQQAVDNYLLNGDAPANGTTCP